MTAQDFTDGQIILIDKPLHWTSFQVVNKLKWAILKTFKIKKIKIGHAGTLDPLATGLLVVCTGKFTKKIPTLQGQEKTYTGEIFLGATTPSYDLETPVNQTFPTGHITPEMIQKAQADFTGEIMQTPPIFSAIKKDGKRLYELARQGKDAEIQPRPVQIYNLELSAENFPVLSFEVKCSKGTYIRSLANDIGKELGSGGYLQSLRRTQIGSFSVAEALSPEDFVAQKIHSL